MALNQVEKVRINGLLKDHSTSDIYYEDMCALVGWNRGDDLENFFLDLIEKKLKADSKTSEKILEKLFWAAYTVVGYTTDHTKQFLNEETIQHIKEIEPLYDAYLEKHSLKENEKIRRNIHDFKISIVDIYTGMDPIEEAKETSELSEELNVKIEELTEELKQKEKELKELKKDNAQKDRAIDKRTTLISTLTEETKKLQEQLKTLTNAKTDLDKTVDKLEKKVLEQTKTNSELVEQVDSLDNQITSLQLERQVAIKEKRIVLIKDEVISALMVREHTLEELVDILNAKGFNTEAKEIFNIIQELRTSYEFCSLEKQKFPVTYQIKKPLNLESNELSISVPVDKSYFDLLVVSDFHLRHISDDIKETLDALNEYAVINSVSLMLNLGDFLGIMREYSSDKLKGLIEEIILKYPYNPQVNQAIVRGNHDFNNKYKIDGKSVDPLSEIIKERNDFIGLGKEHAFVNFNGNNDEQIALHHIAKRFPKLEPSTTYDYQELVKEINKYYSKVNLDRDNSYIDLLGHIHRGSINVNSGYAVVPSLLKDRLQNGAYHLRVFFNNLGKIDYIMFIPLVLNKKLEPMSEVIYKKLVPKA